jgi:hypothetical protein
MTIQLVIYLAPVFENTKSNGKFDAGILCCGLMLTAQM